MEEIENPLFYRRIKKRDEAAFNRLIDAYSKLLWAVASRSGATNSMDLEEVISDVFLRLWEQPEKFDEKKGSLKTYLCIMTESMAKNKMQQVRRRQHETLVDTEESSANLVSNELEEKAAWQEIYTLIMTFDEPTRQILLWRIFYELTPQEIAKRSGLPTKEIDNRLYRGRKKLRSLVERNSFFREVENT
ncbi:DNA-directed RNA polymerase sigma-70 factor [Enterococcus saigonensis]|uniref:DNA-directed RNA polymerase sigma-70 factor n=1 Tax=Enterococcus saigonensis TaxID=1805431 RepID=A0A679ITN2_9ENTE|nr:sigma-70 family RNA polymerase sigma factor [Enterococcus saigonensis]BCA86987.1 DNA-directed RNA polymerase sigma-70 factor [Enterococcus saigonensis]